MATQALFRIWRGDASGGAFQDYKTDVDEGMVVLDAIHRIQANQAPDMAVRWNCKAGKCGSCSAEINGVPKLMCMTRLNELNLDMPVIVEPMHAFPSIRDLVTDVSWNFASKRQSRNLNRALRTRRMGLGECNRSTWIGCRSSANALNASSARTSATCCGSIKNTKSSSVQGS